MFEPLTLIIGTDAMLQFLNTQLLLRFGNGPLASITASATWS